MAANQANQAAPAPPSVGAYNRALETYLLVAFGLLGLVGSLEPKYFPAVPIPAFAWWIGAALCLFWAGYRVAVDWERRGSGRVAPAPLTFNQFNFYGNAQVAQGYSTGPPVDDPPG